MENNLNTYAPKTLHHKLSSENVLALAINYQV
jgi:hypothetical protein